MQTQAPPSLDAIHAARDRIASHVVRTPMVRLSVEDAPAEIYLKLENLQPIGSFKLRGAGNAILSADSAQLEGGVWAASAGNMAQGVAWHARRLGLPCTVVMPDQAPATKRAAVTRLGAQIISEPREGFKDILETGHHPETTGVFVHPFNAPDVIAGNATIGLEILEDMPDVDTVVIPWGGGGLCCGIAAAIRAVAPKCEIIACELASIPALKKSLETGEPVEVPYSPNFVDGMGVHFVDPGMFSLAQRLVDRVVTVEIAEVASAVRLLAERSRIVAEGAGAAPVAAALAGKAGSGKVVCVVSGGNIDTGNLVRILSGDIPTSPAGQE
jgi:threonine dehydratase